MYRNCFQQPSEETLEMAEILTSITKNRYVKKPTTIPKIPAVDTPNCSITNPLETSQLDVQSYKISSILKYSKLWELKKMNKSKALIESGRIELTDQKQSLSLKKRKVRFSTVLEISQSKTQQPAILQCFKKPIKSTQKQNQAGVFITSPNHDTDEKLHEMREPRSGDPNYVEKSHNKIQEPGDVVQEPIATKPEEPNNVFRGPATKMVIDGTNIQEPSSRKKAILHGQPIEKMQLNTRSAIDDIDTIIESIAEDTDEEIEEVQEIFVKENSQTTNRQCSNDEHIAAKLFNQNEFETAYYDLEKHEPKNQQLSRINKRRKHPVDQLRVSAVEDVEELDFNGFSQEEQHFYKLKRSAFITEMVDNIDAKNKKPCNNYKRSSFVIPNQSYSKLHTRSHILPYCCNLCVETFPNLFDLQRHIKQSHDVPDSRINQSFKKDEENKVSKELWCNATGERLFNLTGKKPYKCGFCDYNSSYPKMLQLHLKVHSEDRIQKCDKCTFTTMKKWVFDRHALEHGNGAVNELECDQCGYSTVHKAQMDLHMQLHNKKEVYKCNICAFTTGHLGYFTTHKSFHLMNIESDSDDEKGNERRIRYKCQECAFSAKKRSILLSHAKKYHNDIPSIRVLSVQANKSVHMCTKCGFILLSLGVLKKHLSIHTDGCGFKCTMCEYKTYTEAKFETHKRRHDKMNKPYKVKQ